MISSQNPCLNTILSKAYQVFAAGQALFYALTCNSSSNFRHGPRRLVLLSSQLTEEETDLREFIACFMSHILKAEPGDIRVCDLKH